MQIISFPQRPDRVAAFQKPTGLRSRYTVAVGVADELGLTTVRAIGADFLLPALVITRPDHCPTYDGPLRDYEDEYQPMGGPELSALIDEHVMTEMAHFAESVESRDDRLSFFATRMAYEPVVPVEESPLEATSVFKLLGKSGSSAALGWIAGVHDPWLLVVTPSMVIAMGAATGVASGLQEGLHRNVIRWMTGSDPGAKEAPPADDGGPVPEQA